jgi:hypothetical protein
MYFTVKYRPTAKEGVISCLVKAANGYEAIKRVIEDWAAQNMDGSLDFDSLHVEKWYNTSGVVTLGEAE